jgi:hypothetical protein
MEHTVDLNRICAILRELGNYAYVEHTGGGVATIYASRDENPDHPGLPGMAHLYPCADRSHEHDPGAQAIAGPGWFVGPTWSTRNTEDLPEGAYASTVDFYIGPDDQGCERPYEATEADDESSLAIRLHRVILADSIADAFIADLKENVTAAQFDEIRRLNATPEYAVADASHNFLDANECMVAAFELVTGEDPNPTDDDDTALWNAAWGIARRRALVA